jgi:hypothetical protein
MNRLYEKGFISNPVGKAKSVVLTDKGLQESERLFSKLFVKGRALTPFVPPLLAVSRRYLPLPGSN